MLLASGGELTLALRPAARLAARLDLPPQEGAPEAVQVRVAGVSAFGEESTRIECPIEKRRMACPIPAGTGLDLRLRARGFVSHYFWDQIAKPREELDLGSLALRRGGSLVDWLEAEGGPLRPEAWLQLNPQGGDGSAVPLAKEAARPTGTFRVHPTERGFFAFEGLSPGSYRLTAGQPGFAVSEVSPIRVFQNGESRLERPMVISPPLKLEVFLDPPQDAYGEDWRVELGRQEVVGRVDPVRLSKKRAEVGAWQQDGLPSGRYLLQVIDSQGAKFGEESFELTPTSGPLTIDLDLVAVEGTLRLGDEPLWAAVTFRWPGGGERVQMISEEDGTFFGFLPKAGEWNILVESEDPDVFRRFPRTAVERLSPQDPARVDLALPGTTLRGVVVDESGVEVAGAGVFVAPIPLAEVPAHQLADEEGEFSFEGLEAGLYEVTAEAERDGETLRSLPESVTLGEGLEPELRLVLYPELKIQGRVVTADGFPIPGATIDFGGLVGRATLALQGGVVTANGEGFFEASLPGHVDGVALDVLAAGFALRQILLFEDLDQPITVTVDSTRGTLVLQLPEEPIHWTDWSQPVPVVFHGPDSLGLAAGRLAQWAEINGVSPPISPTGVLTVPSMPPGEYSVCMVAPRYVDLDTKFLIPPERCEAGVLSPGAELHLRVPAWGGSENDGREAREAASNDETKG
ncbi:MAG: carboxypeptidase-like regulatory domain-containing protein [Acidobacteriota bacterium]